MASQGSANPANPAPRPTANGNSAGNMAIPQQRNNDGQMGASSTAQNPSMSQQNLNGIVIEYLSKKGYNRTEAMLRVESANQDVDGRPIQTRLEDSGGLKYGKAFEFYQREAQLFFVNSKDHFEAEHEHDLRRLQAIQLPEHVRDNELAKIYRSQRYRVTLSQIAFYNLMQFLESKEKEGGAVILSIIQTYVNVATVERSVDDQYSLAKLLARAKRVEDFPAEDEGIPGHNPGSANVERNAGSTVLVRLKLGRNILDHESKQDVLAELEAEDIRSPPTDGQSSRVEYFEQKIKQEESEEAPSRTELPLPPPLARDVAMEVQRVKENRDRFKIEGRTGGVGPGLSIVMHTFHNTNESLTCLDFSGDYLLVAAGTNQHYVRVWTLDGKALPSAPGFQEAHPSGSRRLIGHSGPVYAVSFAPSSDSSDSAALTHCKYLLSASADKTVCLWSLESWSALVVYKGHDHPVWDVCWGPFGHYFLTGSYDKTARLWSTDRADFLRMFVGHERDVDTVCFHPNSAYIFTGGSDKMVRMWAVSNGYPARMFTGHTGNVTSLSCSPSGKILASADDVGTIILWDLTPGKLLKRMRGHGKGGIWSLSWSVESTTLVSGGADGTVRVWDAQLPNDADGQGKVMGEGVAQKIDGGAQVTNAAGAGGKKKAKEVMVTSDQISAFATKKSPVYKVMFTQRNLVLAGGAYLP
ncbi:MAG: hypothetical protein LQ351_000407 [Letrouitia transgressa]|nr:MAG: hypothetical protein LQ351_000407 [Letrouitia transgressa]